MHDSDSTSSVATLLALMQAGDVAALDVIARTYGPRLLAVARRRCHQREDAEDAVQQALLVARDSMRSFRGDRAPIAWLSTLVSRTCSRFNARRARVVLQHDAIDAPCECGGACDEDPSVLAERSQLATILSRALMTLSRTDRLAFLLSVEGFDSVEIAERFSLTHNAVRSRLKRARKVLREAIERDDTLAAVRGTPRAESANDREPPQHQ
jgi:RNA polymerase sigma-70 factor (ECF subfamily)